MMRIELRVILAENTSEYTNKISLMDNNGSTQE